MAIDHCWPINNLLKRPNEMSVRNIARFLEKIFNDSVHGPIRLHPLCVKIIDTPEFQRLRNIKQLGTTYLVYPAASHNRFEHSLGVCYLAGRMVDALRNNLNIYAEPSLENYSGDLISKVDKLCVEIAGLCHDIGHGPFSHLWELVLADYGIKWQHERGSTDLFDHLIKTNGLIKDFEYYGINENKRKLIKELILGEGESLTPENRFLFQIVANKDNDIDVDKWDYFLRDGLLLNLKITFDYNRLLQFCCVVNHPEKESYRVIGYKNKEADNLHDMFRVRADLHRKAYQHTVVKNLDLMYIDVFTEANKHFKVYANKEVSTLSEAHKNMKVFTRLTDHVFDSIMNDPNPNLESAQNLISRIQKRKLYSHINTYLIKIQQSCCEVDVCDIKERLNSYFRKRFDPHELRFCPIKLEYNRHIESLKKVVVFDTRDRSKLTRIDVSKIIGPLPLEEDAYSGSTFLQIHVFCQTNGLHDDIRNDINDEIKRALYYSDILNSNNNNIEQDPVTLIARTGGSGGRSGGSGDKMLN